MNNPHLPYYGEALPYQQTEYHQSVYLPPVNHLINQPIHQPLHHPIHQHIHQPIDQSLHTVPPVQEEEEQREADNDDGAHQSDADAQQDEPDEDVRPALEPVGELPTECIYESPQAVFEAVHAWGARVGVDLVRRKARSTKKGLPPYRWMMVCARSGRKDSRNGRGLRKRGSMKCNCPFRFHCVAINPQNVNGEYRVTLAGGDAQRHNHLLARPDSLNGAKRRMRRQEAEQRQQQIKNLRRIGVADTQMREYLEEPGPSGPPAQISDLSELIWRVD